MDFVFGDVLGYSTRKAETSGELPVINFLGNEQREYATRGYVEEDEMSVEDAVFKFNKLEETELARERPQQHCIELWVFWSPEQFFSSSSPSSGSYPANEDVKQWIKSALCNTSWVKGYFYNKTNLLIQFWAATNTDGGRCVLTTRNQPFALMRLDRGFVSYRQHSLEGTIEVDDEKYTQLLLGRVYRNKLIESTPNIAYYSTSEYPQKEFAINCGVRSSLAFPVFERSRRNFVGVLELVSSYEYILDLYANKALEEIRQLQFPFSHNFLDKNILENASKEIDEVLQVVCRSHQLPLAQSWVIRSGISYSEDVLVVSSSSVISQTLVVDSNWLSLKEACGKSCLRKYQGLVGKALLLCKPCFCRDITQFSMTEYPLAHYARYCGSIGSFTICMRSDITNEDYVLEFFFPSQMDSKESHTLLTALLATLKEHFRTFKVASGEILGEELCVEVFESSINNKPESFKICQPNRSLPEPSALENEGEMEALDPLDQQLIVEVALQHDGNVLGAEGKGDTTKSSIEKAYVKESSEREHKKTGNDISDGVLKENFGRPLKDVAKSLNVSRSTFKRACRKHGISDWRLCRKHGISDRPSHKRNKVCLQSSNDKMPRMQATNDVAHTVPHITTVEDKMPCMQNTNDVAPTVPPVMPVEDMNTVTVKATYNGFNIKFRLSFSSGMAELEENVTKRLHLERRNFSIKYKDDEDDEDDKLVLLASDDDLQDLMHNARLKKTAIIRMLIDMPITHLAP